MSSLYSTSCYVLSNMSRVSAAITSRMRFRNVERSGTRAPYTRPLTYSHKKKSNEVIPGENGGQQICPSRPIQRSGKVFVKVSAKYELQCGEPQPVGRLHQAANSLPEGTRNM